LSEEVCDNKSSGKMPLLLLITILDQDLQTRAGRSLPWKSGKRPKDNTKLWPKRSTGAIIIVLHDFHLFHPWEPGFPL